MDGSTASWSPHESGPVSLRSTPARQTGIAITNNAEAIIMSSDFALMVLSEMLWSAMTIAAPVLGLTLLVGIAISIFQVVTQLQEMSLAFIPKLLVAAFTLIAFGGWMLNHLIDFSRTLIANIPQYL
jgi:flagellar biosynthetic protein FliQ